MYGLYILEKKPEKHIEPDPPFEWVEFRRPDGKFMKHIEPDGKFMKHIEPDPPFEWVEFRRPDGN